MALTAYAAARTRNLFAVVILSGIFSLLAAVLYVVLNAVDVAFTEAAVGANINFIDVSHAITNHRQGKG